MPFLSVAEGDAPCGLWIEAGQFQVVLPTTYQGVNIASHEVLPLSLRFLAVLQRYYDEGRRAVADVEASAVETFGGPSGTVLDRLEVALLLWEDWKKYRELSFSDVRLGYQKPGKIQWDKTLRTHPPVQDVGGIVFQHLIQRRVEPIQDHPIQCLYLYTIKEIAGLMGEGMPMIWQEKPRQSPRSIIASWKQHCFGDRQLRVVLWLERYYEALHATSGEGQSVGVRANKFAYVWERMLRVALGAQSPKAVKHHYNGISKENDWFKVNDAYMELRPDMILIDEKEAFIKAIQIDAKYYPPDKWPSTADLVKQFAYLCFRVGCEHIPASDIRSVFLFPIAIDGDAYYRGQHSATSMLALSVSLACVMASYLRGEPNAELIKRVLYICNIIDMKLDISGMFEEPQLRVTSDASWNKFWELRKTYGKLYETMPPESQEDLFVWIKNNMPKSLNRYMEKNEKDLERMIFPTQ